MITIHGKQVPTHWSEMVDPRTTAFLLIDMQNDCCSPGGTVDRAGGDISGYPAMLKQAAALLDYCRSAGVLVIHSQMQMLPGGRSDSSAWLRLRMRMTSNYGTAQPESFDYMVENTWGEQFVEEVQPIAGEVVITKYRSSAMVATNLDLVLRSNRIETVLVAGCTTEGCVESTVRDLGFFDYNAIVLSDCVGSDVPELHAASMLVMGAYRAEIATAREVLAYWRHGVVPSRRTDSTHVAGEV